MRYVNENLTEIGFHITFDPRCMANFCDSTQRSTWPRGARWALRWDCACSQGQAQYDTLAHTHTYIHTYIMVMPVSIKQEEWNAYIYVSKETSRGVWVLILLGAKEIPITYCVRNEMEWVLCLASVLWLSGECRHTFTPTRWLYT